jgi:hypothetical protein
MRARAWRAWICRQPATAVTGPGCRDRHGAGHGLNRTHTDTASCGACSPVREHGVRRGCLARRLIASLDHSGTGQAPRLPAGRPPVGGQDGVGDLGQVGADHVGPLPSGSSTLPGRATKAAAKPARAAPATSQACAAISRTSPTATPNRSAAMRYGSGAGLRRRTVSADSTSSEAPPSCLPRVRLGGSFRAGGGRQQVAFDRSVSVWVRGWHHAPAVTLLAHDRHGVPTRTVCELTKVAQGP